MRLLFVLMLFFLDLYIFGEELHCGCHRASLLGARMLLVAPGLTASNKKLLETSALLVVTRS